MYRKHHNGQISIEEFHVPFSGTLDSENRWVLFSALMPWEELEQAYAPQFSEVGAFYWTVPAPDIVNLGREEQGLVSV